MKKLAKPIKLTPEETAKNKLVFTKTNEKFNIFTEEFLEFLGEDIYTAPASTLLDLHNCFEGGLLDHLIKVTTYAHKINEILPEDLRQEKESITKVCFLSEIGKVKLYTPEFSQWHKDNMGRHYNFNNELTTMRVGERSAYYANTFGVKLKDYEFQAIVAHDADETNNMYKWHSDILTNILKAAIKFAIIEEKEKWNSIQQ